METFSEFHLEKLKGTGMFSNKDNLFILSCWLFARIDNENLRRVARLIDRAENPIIYAGQGAVDAYVELRALAEIADIPVTTTLHALGVFDESHPLSLNMVSIIIFFW